MNARHKVGFRILVFASILVWIFVIIASLLIMQVYGDLKPYAALDNSLRLSAGGRITDESGIGVSGARVVLARDGKNNYMYADSGGRFLIRRLEAGDYKITVGAEGFEIFESTMNLRNSGDYTFTLLRQAI